MMIYKLKRIEERMVSAAVSPTSFFPPIDAASVVQAAGGYALPAHNLLYSWHNGQRMEDFYEGKTLPFWQGYFLLPIEEAVDRGRDAGMIGGGEFWMPVLDNYAGEFIFVDLGNGDRRGRVGYYTVVPECEQPVDWRHDSIEALVDQIADAWLFDRRV